MAAIAIPIISAIGAPVINLITSLVHKSAPAAEQKYGPKTGPVKYAAVFSDVMDALNKAADAGQIDKKLPTDPTVQLIIQTVVSSMNISGQLAPPATAAPAATGQTITLAPGQYLVQVVKS